MLAISETGNLDDENYRPCEGHANNLETLRRAFEADAVCLLEVTLKATGERCAAICAAVGSEDGSETSFVPFAIMLNGNPYELLIPPDEA